MEYMFITLSMDITMTLNKIKDRIYSEMAVKYTQIRFTEAIKTKREEYKAKHPENANAVDYFIKFIKDELIAEVDQKIKDNVPPHV